jgi:hypothetical protein
MDNGRDYCSLVRTAYREEFREEKKIHSYILFSFDVKLRADELPLLIA